MLLDAGSYTESVTELLPFAEVAIVSRPFAEEMAGAPLLLAVRNTEEPRLAPPADEMIWVGTILGVMGTRDQVGRFALDNQCRVQPRLRTVRLVANQDPKKIERLVVEHLDLALAVPHELFHV